MVCKWNLTPADWKPGHQVNVALPVSCIAFDPRGETLAIGMGDLKTVKGAVQVVDAETLEGVTPHKPIDMVVHDLCFGPDGDTVATATGTRLSGQVLEWDASGEPAGAPLEHLSEVFAVAYSAESDDQTRFLLTGGQDRSVRIWDLKTRRMLAHPVWHR